MTKPGVHGFTLVEMIVVIVITGIIGTAVAVFLHAPVRGYLDSARRAGLSDIADTALRRVARDLRSALPNSVRRTESGGRVYLEFIPATGGGRYRAGADSAGLAKCPTLADDELNFDKSDTCFEVLGAMPTPAPQAGDFIVVYNMGDGHANANAYSGAGGAHDNRRAISSVGAHSISMASSGKLPFSSCVTDSAGSIVGGCRFHVVRAAVSYVCDPAAGTLARWQYAIQAAQPTALPAGGTSALLASHVAACDFSYDAFVVAQRAGLVTMHLAIAEQGESVTLYSATHVSNVP